MNFKSATYACHIQESQCLFSQECLFYYFELYFNFKRCWLVAVFGPAHALVGMRIHGEVDFECPPQLLLQLIFLFVCLTQCIFLNLRLAILAMFVGQQAPEFCFSLPPTTQIYTVTSGFYVAVHQVLTLMW